ncbi:MAG TPA: enolase C-terminal domain-like protein [Cytophagaceae bacterium]|nr:enolase C-terminal domain-like protein [Cytophagaceae bacterium]
MISWSIKELRLELKYSWKISRNESLYKQNFIIAVTDGTIAAYGEVAPNIRYGENPERIFQTFTSIIPQLNSINTLIELHEIIDNESLMNSLQFGIESAYIHYLAKKRNIPVYQELGLQKPGEIYTSYTLPIMEIGKVKNFIEEYNLLRFKYLKIKIDQDNGRDLLDEVTKVTDLPLRVDANEAWQDVDNLLVFMEGCKRNNIQFIEQPLPSSKKEEYKYLKSRSPFELIADESVTNNIDIEEVALQFHGVNMKLMKAGGYLNGIKILQNAKKQGLKTMIGCMVETSLGIFSAINLCNDINYIDLDGHFLIENEPFNMVAESEGRLFNIT